jgi:hypothetical protein
LNIQLFSSAGQIDNFPTLGRVYRAPKSFRGSVRYYQDAYARCLAICKKVGTPHLLITLTENTDWPELKHMLRPGQPYCDRPDCCCRLFIDKLHELMKDIFNKHVMGPTLGGFYSIEHQKGYFVR